MHQIGLAIGVVVLYLFAYILSLIFSDVYQYWYIVFGTTLPLIIIQSVLLFTVSPYETPAYLLAHGRPGDARDLIEMIYKE